MTEPMTDEQLELCEGRTPSGMVVKMLTNHIRRLRKENAALKKDKGCWEDGWVEVAKARELLENAELCFRDDGRDAYAQQIRVFLDGEKG